MAKVANNKNNLVKGSLTRQKLQNSKGYAKSPEFSPALGLIVFGETARLRARVIKTHLVSEVNVISTISSDIKYPSHHTCR